MSTAENKLAAAARPDAPLPIVKRMLNTMWGYWMFLLAISFGVAAVIYWVWLRGSV